jgi:hypothetical protein
MVVLGKQGGGSNDHAIGAVPTLGCLFFDECLLDWMKLSIFHQAFKGYDGSLPDIGNGDLAGLLGFPSEYHHTGAALFQPTTKLRTMQPQLISQYI